MDYKTVFTLAQEKGYKRWSPVLIEDYDTDDDEFWAVAEISMLQKWLRDEHNLAVEVQWKHNIKYHEVYTWHLRKADTLNCRLDAALPSYEQALVEGVYKALKLLP